MNSPRKIIPIIRAETLIPRGMYCYESMTLDETKSKDGLPVFSLGNRCPFRSINTEQVEKDEGSLQGAGYCSYLKLGDWMENGTSLLWDSVKECGVNMGDYDD